MLSSWRAAPWEPGDAFSMTSGYDIAGSLRRLTLLLSRGLQWVGVAAGLAVLVVAFADVAAYKLFQRPIVAMYDLTRFGLLLSVASMGSMALVKGSHLHIDVFVSKLPLRVRAIVDILMSILGFATCAAIVWHGVLYGLNLQHAGERSVTTGVPACLLAYIMAASFVPIALEFLARLANSANSLHQARRPAS